MTNPQEELKKMNVEIEQASDLSALKGIFFRLKEIAQNHPDDFDVQIALSETRQRLMSRGSALEKLGSASAPPPPPMEAPPPPPTYPVETAASPLPPEPILPPPMPEFAPPSAPLDFMGSAPPPAPPTAPEPPLVPPPAPRRPVTKPAKPVRPAKPPKKSLPWGAVVPGIVVGLAIAIGLVVFEVNQTRKNTAKVAAVVHPVQVNVATVPPGAAVRVIPASGTPGGAESTCTANCTLPLKPGDYQVTASLAGYEPAAGSVHVAAGQPAQVSLPLQPQAQSLRLVTDLDQGKVILDDQPAGDLQEGQLVLDKVAPGSHTVKINGRTGDASFPIEIADGKMPAVSGPVTVHNLIAVVVASFGTAARVVTSSGPLKLAVNGQPQSDAGPAGTDVASFQTGVDEIVVGEGKDERKMSDDFGAAPMVTAFLKTDVNAGALIVSTGQDDVRVFLNDKEYKRRTQHGQLRIMTLGKVTVRVSKSGFLDEPAQSTEVKKGEEARLQFTLKPQPQFGSLDIHGATPGADVLLDQKSVGTVGADGAFHLGTVQPGDHALELRHAQYTPKKLQRAFQAGQTVSLTGADVVLVSTIGTIHLTRSPAGAAVTYRRADENESHEFKGNQMELPAGTYVFAATAPGFIEGTARAQLAGGESRPVEITLVHERPAAPVAPVIVTHGITDFEDPQAWKQEGDVWVHRGAGFVPYALPAKGTFTFTVQLPKGGGLFHAAKIRWCVAYVDAKNYLVSEMDRKTFWTGVMDKGMRLERKKAPITIDNPKSFTIQIEVSPEQLVQRVQIHNQWVALDTFTETERDFTKGKFGFLLQGSDEIAISDFKFVPR